MKRPSFQFYPADWRADTALQSCSLAARGLWIELMCLAHECDPYGVLMVGGAPMQPKQIARIVGISEKNCRFFLNELLSCGAAAITAEGAIFSRRMVRDEAIRSARAAGGVLGKDHGIKGLAFGSMGGRPRLGDLEGGVKKPPFQPPLHPPFEPPLGPPLKPPPSSSSSSSIAISDEMAGIHTISGEMVSPRRADDAPPGQPSLSLVSPTADPAAQRVPECPHLAILQLWATVLPEMPQHDPQQWRGARATHLRARWRETAAAKRWPSAVDGLAYFRKLFAFIGRSRYLTGRVTPRDPGRRPFCVELAWLVKPENWAKTIEGKYHEEVA